MFILNTTPVIPPPSQVRVGPNSRRSTTTANDLDEDLAAGGSDSNPYTLRGPDTDTVTAVDSIGAVLDDMNPNNPFYQYYLEARRRGLEYITTVNNNTDDSQSGSGNVSGGEDSTSVIPPELPALPHTNEINDHDRRIPPPPQGG